MLHCPRCVFLEGETSLVSLKFITNLNGACAFFDRSTLFQKQSAIIGYNGSEEIIPVQTLPKIIDIVPSLFANTRICGRLQVIEIVDTVVISVSIQEGLLDQIEIVHDLGE